MRWDRDVWLRRSFFFWTSLAASPFQVVSKVATIQLHHGDHTLPLSFWVRRVTRRDGYARMASRATRACAGKARACAAANLPLDLPHPTVTPEIDAGAIALRKTPAQTRPRGIWYWHFEHFGHARRNVFFVEDLLLRDPASLTHASGLVCIASIPPEADRALILVWLY